MKDIELFINESIIYDQFGNNMKIGDNVIFYYEDGIAGEDDKTKTHLNFRKNNYDSDPVNIYNSSRDRKSNR